MELFNTLAQTYTYRYETVNTGASTGLGIAIVLTYLFFLAVFYVFMSICLMKIFKKAGRKDAWAAWVPIYNTWVMAEIAGYPGWVALLAFVPLINIVVTVLLAIDLAKAFGKDIAYGLLVAFVPIVGYPLLAFGKDAYQGPNPSFTGLSGGNPPQASNKE